MALVDDATAGDASAGPGALAAAYLDQADLPLVLVDGRGRVSLCNPAARRLLLGDGAGAVTARALLRRVRAEGALPWRALLAALRARRAVRLSLRLGQHGAGDPVEVGLRPLSPHGWSVQRCDPAATASGVAEPSRPDRTRCDPLTGLADRLHLQERFSEALARLARLGEGCAVLMVDLDRFKPVNDTLGHAVGDALLRKVAERLRSAIRPTDTLARVGGDEFVVLQGGIAAGSADAGAGGAQTLARRVVDLVGRAYMIDGHLLNVGASVGVALAPRDGAEAELLLRSADLALYRAKADGRGSFRFFEPEMDARMQARRLLELELRKALALKQFELHYQPQLNLETDRLVGCEALLRWRHPERGMVSPLEFVPLAEEIGLIVPIGEWVVRTACKAAAAWPDEVSIAVNLSPVQFKAPRLVETVAAAIAQAGLAPRRLELEITEGVLLQDNEATLATLHRLRALGVRISMDDFGTGYSSLSYLRSFPFDKIKIDRSFVADLAGSPDGDAIVRAIAGLGASLGMTTVAEGVETLEQMDRIRREGCTDVQGYLISRPVSAEAVAKLLNDQRRLRAA